MAHLVRQVRRTILQTEERTEARKELVHRWMDLLDLQDWRSSLTAPRLIRLRIRREDLEHRQYFLQPGQVTPEHRTAGKPHRTPSFQ